MVLLNKPFLFLFFLTILIASVYSDDAPTDPCGDEQINDCIICLCGCRGKHGIHLALCDAECGIICSPPESN